MGILPLLLSLSVGVTSAAPPIAARETAALPTLPSSLPPSPDVARAAAEPNVSGKYFGARYYGSRIGRFTTTDPVYTWQENLVDPQARGGNAGHVRGYHPQGTRAGSSGPGVDREALVKQQNGQ